MIKFRNLRIWLVDQWKRKTFFRNFFITRNAWGAFSINFAIIGTELLKKSKE